MGIHRLRILFDLTVTAELAGTKLDLEYESDSVEAAQAVLTMDAVWDWWDAGVSGSPAQKTLFKPAVSLARVTIQRISPTIGGVFVDDRADIPGTYAAGDTLSPNVSMVASYRTDVSARRQRGRSYFPAPPADEVTAAGTLNTAWQQSFINGVMSLAEEVESPARLAVGTLGIEHVIWSTGAVDPGPPPAPLPDAAFPVTRYLAGNRVDTQRKRLGNEVTYVTGV